MFNLFYFTGYKIEYKTQDYDYKCSKNKTAIQVNVIVCLQAIPWLTICSLFIHVTYLIPACKINVGFL